MLTRSTQRSCSSEYKRVGSTQLYQPHRVLTAGWTEALWDFVNSTQRYSLQQSLPKAAAAVIANQAEVIAIGANETLFNVPICTTKEEQLANSIAVLWTCQTGTATSSRPSGFFGRFNSGCRRSLQTMREAAEPLIPLRTRASNRSLCVLQPDPVYPVRRGSRRILTTDRGRRSKPHCVVVEAVVGECNDLEVVGPRGPTQTQVVAGSSLQRRIDEWGSGEQSFEVLEPFGT